MYKELFDSGASATLVNQAAVRHLKKTVTKDMVFSTTVGNLSTHGKCQIKLKIPEFNLMAEISKTVHVTKTLGNYGIIIGWDLLHELGADISFTSKTMAWNDVTIDMKPPTCTCKDAFHVEEEQFVSYKTDAKLKSLMRSTNPKI